VLGVDTNILVRFVTRDDPVQFQQASALLSKAGEDGLFANPVVLVELHWVLSKVYRMPKADILAVLEGLLESRELVVDQRDLVAQALNVAKRMGVDFSDVVIALLNQQSGCISTVTFDKPALRMPQFGSVEGALT
jgi:Predicted nucleic-acid-binding protein, contains PIN domain